MVERQIPDFSSFRTENSFIVGIEHVFYSTEVRDLTTELRRLYLSLFIFVRRLKNVARKEINILRNSLKKYLFN